MKNEVERIMHTNGHLDNADIEQIAKRELWQTDGFRRVGGQ